jgi:hypothetical protein
MGRRMKTMAVTRTSRMFMDSPEYLVANEFEIELYPTAPIFLEES